MMGPGIILKDFKIFKDLGLISQMRGLDGAGVYQTRSAQHTKGWTNLEAILKTGDNFSSLITDIDDDHDQPYNKREYKELLSSCQVDVVMGHVRAQTKGSIIEANAHPFIFNNLVGAHNGTLKDKKYEHTTKTDSELMFKDISERGLKTVLNDMDKASAYAIVMYNKENHKMYFVRNDLRPLSFAFLEDRGVMFWASELYMLKFVLDRFGEKYKACSLLPYKIIEMYANDITLKKINEDFLSLVKVVDHIDPPPPPPERESVVYVNGVRQNRNSTVTTKTFMGHNVSVPSIPPADTGGQGTLPFPKTTTSIVQFHGKCVCEKHELNLISMHYAKRGLNKDIRYEEASGKFFCIDCDTIKCSEIVNG